MTTEIKTDAPNWDEYLQKVFPERAQNLKQVTRYSKNFFSWSSIKYLFGDRINLPREAMNEQKENEFWKRLDEVKTSIKEELLKYSLRFIYLDTFRNKSLVLFKGVCDIALGGLGGVLGSYVGGIGSILVGIAGGVFCGETLIGLSEISLKNDFIKDLENLDKDIQICYNQESLVVTKKIIDFIKNKNVELSYYFNTLAL